MLIGLVGLVVLFSGMVGVWLGLLPYLVGVALVLAICVVSFARHEITLWDDAKRGIHTVVISVLISALLLALVWPALPFILGWRRKHAATPQSHSDSQNPTTGSTS
jgi:hypothetical protein